MRAIQRENNLMAKGSKQNGKELRWINVNIPTDVKRQLAGESDEGLAEWAALLLNCVSFCDGISVKKGSDGLWRAMFFFSEDIENGGPCAVSTSATMARNALLGNVWAFAIELDYGRAVEPQDDGADSDFVF